MGEIGSGSGSAYPGALDTNATIEVDAPNAGKTKAKAATPNDLGACIIAIETELGVDPAGSKATVVARLDQEHNADGSHKDTLVVTVSGNNQTVSGRKVFTSGISLGVEGLYGTATGHTVGRTTVGASGAMWFADDIRTSGSIYVGGTNVSTNFNADMVDGLHAGGAVNGFVRGILIQIDENGESAGKDIDSGVTQNVWTSVGPTGSGATLIWTELDAIPSGAKAVILQSIGGMSDTAAGTYHIELRARKTGTSVTSGYNLLYSDMYKAASVDVAATGYGIIPIDSSRRFDVKWDKTAALDTTDIWIYLQGWLE